MHFIIENYADSDNDTEVKMNLGNYMRVKTKEAGVGHYIPQRNVNLCNFTGISNAIQIASLLKEEEKHIRYKEEKYEEEQDII